MRTLILVTSAMGLGLAACASTGVENRYLQEERQLAENCRSQGGILAPTGQTTGRPQVDNVCRITGGASRLTSQDPS